MTLQALLGYKTRLMHFRDLFTISTIAVYRLMLCLLSATSGHNDAEIVIETKRLITVDRNALNDDTFMRYMRVKAGP